MGSGGREHALALAFSRSGAEVVCSPGNPGIAAFPGAGGITCSALPQEDVDADLFVIGPEAPLVDGLANRLRAAGKLVVGPGSDGAMLEGSKAWMKQVVTEAGVPTAAWAAFDDLALARAHLATLEAPYVIKADGLAAGKGVLVTHSLDEAYEDLVGKLSGRSFGAAGRVVVIEEAMAGPEISVMALCDGKRAVALPPARDAKRLSDGDLGPNTGGMGAYSPLHDVSSAVVEEIMERCVLPSLGALSRRGIDYRGVLYAGCMITEEGPKLVEFNVRMGDPEAQVVLPLLDDGALELFVQAAQGDLRDEPRVSGDAAVCIVLAAEDYPERPKRGAVIEGIEEAADIDGVSVLQAGTRLDADGALVANGGRVINVVGRAGSVAEARRRAYEGVHKVAWPGATWRSDIARAAAQEDEV